MSFGSSTIAAALVGVGGLVLASAASAQALTLAIRDADPGAPMAQAAPPQPLQIQTLIGAQAIEPSQHAAVISLAPVDYPYAPGDEVGLPLTRRGGSATSMSGGSPVSCLTQAVYYEARSESLEGQQAVAQVVINRTRNGHYPTSVCDVVYQGGTRRTGCQFTFVCDGSRNGRIQPTAWSRAQAVAEKALGGFEYTPLIGATHYHASWMTPYWSSSLTKMRQIGGHIFYR